MKIIKVWGIYTLNGPRLPDRGGNLVNKYYAATKEAADAWKFEYPSDQVIEKQFVVYDSFDELQDIEQKNLRKTVLAKLTPAEKKVLGIAE